jgi:hypothetical protein
MGRGFNRPVKEFVELLTVEQEQVQLAEEENLVTSWCF